MFFLFLIHPRSYPKVSLFRYFEDFILKRNQNKHIGQIVKRVFTTTKIVPLEQTVLVFKRNPEPFQAASLISTCNRQGNFDLALDVYKTLLLKSRPDLFVFTSIINACRKIQPSKIGSLLEDMDRYSILPDKGCFALLTAACAKNGDTKTAKKLLKMVEDGLLNFTLNELDCAQLIQALSIGGQMDDAMSLLNHMHQKNIPRNPVVYICLLTACKNLTYGKIIHAHMEKHQEKRTGKLDSCLINMYANCGSLEDARTVFEGLQSRDVVVWNSMINAYIKDHQFKAALELFSKMQKEGIDPSHVSYTLAISACAESAALSTGKQIHRQISESGIKADTILETTLINMYSKCGDIEKARSIFLRVQNRNTVTWNSMLAGYAQHGCGKEALDLFRQMEISNVKPDDKTFSSLFSACGHSGLADEALLILDQMQTRFNIKPDTQHYTSVIDALGRIGRLQDAEDLIKSIAEPDAVVWISLLGGCRWHGDVARAERAAENALRLQPKNTASFVLLANIYASVGRWSDHLKTRKLMEELGIKKDRGQTWIELDGIVHTFSANDKYHERADEIYAQLNELNNKMKEVGYVPNTKYVVQEVGAKEKEDYVCSHSEKLAIGLGLISTQPGTPLLITQNIRICPDCHNASKIISNICNRQITLRDNYRFHHFRDGECSCKDYW